VPTIDEISFDSTSYQLVLSLIDALKSTGDCAVYGLPGMNKPKGELRIAHLGPNLQKKKGRGVFARIQPTISGATVILPRRFADGERRTELTASNADKVLKNINSWRSQAKDKVKANEKD
jgi:hypothetical protein